MGPEVWHMGEVLDRCCQENFPCGVENECQRWWEVNIMRRMHIERSEAQLERAFYLARDWWFRSKERPR